MNASPAFRESLEGLLQGYYDLMLDGIAGGRHMPVSRAEELLGRGPCAALEAKQAGLVDDVLFYDELLGQLQERDGEKPLVQKDYGATARERPLSFLSLLMGGPIVPRPTPGGPAIAVLYAVGPIFSGEEDLSLGEQAVASEDFIQVIREAAADANVKAIVLRVDSPGGSALACDQIWRELRLADRKKPVVASFSDTAASGGYYIGAAARKIYAEPGTLTGSIGVVGGKLVLAGLLGKIGVNVEVFERGHGGGFLSSFEEFSPAERRRLQELVQDTYRTFLSRVAETRPALSGARLEQVAGGRVWTGKQAHDNGLVDEVGGLSEAIQAAKEAAGIPPEQTVRIMHLPRARSLVEVLLFGSDKQAQAPSPWDAMSMALPVPELRAYLRALTLLRGETSLCILPAALIIR
jgi:protease-4